MIITELDAGDPEAPLAFAIFGGTSVPANRTLHALADEILKYRRALRLLARAIGCPAVTEAGTAGGCSVKTVLQRSSMIPGPLVIALTDAQLKIVQELARPLQRWQRDRFLQ